MTCTCVFSQILVETSTCSQWKISHWSRGCPKEVVTPWEGCTGGRTHVGAHGELSVMGEIPFPVPWCCWWAGVMEFRRKVKPERKEGMRGRFLKFWVCFSFPYLDLIVNNLFFLSVLSAPGMWPWLCLFAGPEEQGCAAPWTTEGLGQVVIRDLRHWCSLGQYRPLKISVCLILGIIFQSDLIPRMYSLFLTQ